MAGAFKKTSGRNNVIRKKSIKNSVLDYIIYKQLNWYGHFRRMNEERLPQKFWKGVHLEKKKRKNSKFVGAGSNNWNEREGN